MENDFHEKSKSQIKREAEELQKLGEKLIALPVSRLKIMNLPDKLLQALIDAQSITANVAARRQRQYIGALMREVDPEPIRDALNRKNPETSRGSELEKEIDRVAERLITGEEAAQEEFISACPGLERQRLRQILRNIQKENKTGKSSKSLKKLQQLIRESLS